VAPALDRQRVLIVEDGNYPGVRTATLPRLEELKCTIPLRIEKQTTHDGENRSGCFWRATGATALANARLEQFRRRFEQSQTLREGRGMNLARVNNACSAFCTKIAAQR
jgi:hypothetical protein